MPVYPDRILGGKPILSTFIIVPKQMVRTFFRLAIALQFVVLRHFLVADRTLLPWQLSSQVPCALAYPRQGRFRIALRLRLNQTVQRYE